MDSTMSDRLCPSSMPRFDLNLLAALDALLREKNVTSAAEDIGVSQPTMSGMLKRLRDHLQDQILVRAGTQYELTARANELREPVRQVLLTVEDLTRPSGAQELREIKRHVRIMASELPQMMILPDLFQRALAEAPHLSFEVLPIFDPISRVYSGDVDLCITGAPLAQVPEPAARLIRTRKVLDVWFVALVDKYHPLQDPVTMDQLLSYPHVETQFPGLATSVEEGILYDRSRHNPPLIKVPNFLGVSPMIAGTKRICVMPEILFDLVSSPWGLRALSLPDNFAPTPLRTMWHMRYDMDPLHRWMRSAIQEAAARLQRPDRSSPVDEEADLGPSRQ
jgi:LysR family transcriptional regulator, nod-box dependent transcriptional activator